MKALLDDLLEYSRTKLSLGILIRPTQIDLAEVCSRVVDEIRAAEPNHEVQLRIVGEGHGFWDPHRLHQVLSNLLGNAMAYGAPNTPVVLELRGSERHVTVAVTNEGPLIPRETLKTLLEPLQRGSNDGDARAGRTHLGLGLFVSQEIVKAHHGQIEADSREGATVFRVCLPRRSP